jgi:branched-chain amino acid transport system ATP-binding protein
MNKLMSNIQTLRDQKGITFLLIEHDMDLVMNLCQPVIVMSEGKKLAEGNAEEIKSNEQVLEAYLGGQYR